MKHSEIQNFYKDRHVFVTGGSGFVGKVLIEKLLRSTEVAKIYILIREKKEESMKKRLEKLFNEVVFDRVKAETEGYRQRICGISGDCSLPKLGISDTDRSILLENVDVVFHVAATTRFDEKLRSAYAINVQGTKDCLELSKSMKKLKAFMYVSTAYSNSIFMKVQEKFYDPPVKYEKVETILKKFNDQEIEELLPTILGEWTSTYTFTKQLAEDLIKRNADGVPTGIFRPAIVTNAYKEPYEGWGDSLTVTMGIVLQVVAGNIKTMQLSDKDYAENVPVDYCVSCLIAAAWDITKTNKVNEATVYNYVSSTENPLTWGELSIWVIKYMYEYPFSKYPYPITFWFIPGKYTIILSRLIYHYLPAFCLDVYMLMRCKKPRYIKLAKKFHRYNDLAIQFNVGQCRFENGNVVRLWNEMKEYDQLLFPFSAKQINWQEYFEAFIKGMRLYLLKDPLNTVDDAKRKLKRNVIKLTLQKIAFVGILLCLLAYVLISVVFK